MKQMLRAPALGLRPQRFCRENLAQLESVTPKAWRGAIQAGSLAGCCMCPHPVSILLDFSLRAIKPIRVVSAQHTGLTNGSSFKEGGAKNRDLGPICWILMVLIWGGGIGVWSSC